MTSKSSGCGASPPSIEDIRRAVADYMWSEGCSCCRNVEAHGQHKEALAKLLGVRKRDDYYDFLKYRTKEKT